MFDNTLYLAKRVVEAGYSSPTTAALVDGPRDRKTLRVSLDGLTEFSVAHQETAENKGFHHTRSNVRISSSKIDEESGIKVTAYAQLTLGIPKGAFSAAEMADIVAQLVVFLMNEGVNPPVSADFGPEALQTTVTRLYAGEP